MNTINTQQPKALYLLFAVKMWECFSFYGMRALLVLYLINQLGMDDVRAFGIYAIYGALVECGGLLGGRLADRLLGLRKSVVYGGWLIAIGHICLSLTAYPRAFYLGLAVIVVGSALFSSNIAALLGLFYEENDPRREAGFTLYYVGVNIGALLASLFCGIIGETYGWHYGFGLAAIGMIAGNILFLCCRSLLEGKGELQKEVPRATEKFGGALLVFIAIPICVLMITWEHVFMQILPALCLLYTLSLGWKMLLSGSFSKRILLNLGMCLGALALFFAAEDQTASALLVFSSRYATETFLGISLPTTTLLSINPFVIIVGGFIMSKIKSDKMSSFGYIIAGLLVASTVFALLSVACLFPNADGLVPLGVVAAAIFAISLGEVLLAPAIFSYFSEVAPKQWLGAVMGLLPLGFSLGNMISGFFSKAMVISEGESIDPLRIYIQSFGLISLLLGLMACVIFIVCNKLDFVQFLDEDSREKQTSA